MTHEHDWQLDYHAHAYYCECGANMSLEQLMEAYLDQGAYMAQFEPFKTWIEEDTESVSGYPNLSGLKGTAPDAKQVEDENDYLKKRIRTLEAAGKDVVVAINSYLATHWLSRDEKILIATMARLQAALETEDAG